MYPLQSVTQYRECASPQTEELDWNFNFNVVPVLLFSPQYFRESCLTARKLDAPLLIIESGFHFIRATFLAIQRHDSRAQVEFFNWKRLSFGLAFCPSLKRQI